MNNTTCRQARGLMSLKLDTALAETDEWRLRRHLDACPACAEQWASLGVLVGELKTAPAVAPPADFVARVMARACPARSEATLAASNGHEHLAEKLAETVPVTTTRRASASRKGLSLAIAAVLVGAVCAGTAITLGVVLGAFNLPYLTALANDAMRLSPSFAALLAFPRALFTACTDLGEALLSPWPVVASGCSALSAALLLTWVYVLMHWQGVPLGQFVNGGALANGTAMGSSSLDVMES